MAIYFPCKLWSQQYVVTGIVSDSASSSFLPGCMISDTIQTVLAVTDKNGKFILHQNRGSHTIICSYIGYNIFTYPYNLQSDTVLYLILKPKSDQIKEVTITSTIPGKNPLDVQNTTTLSRKDLANLPQFLGSTDYFKTLQLLPGIQNSGEGNERFISGVEGRMKIWFCWMVQYCTIQPIYWVFIPFLILM